MTWKFSFDLRSLSLQGPVAHLLLQIQFEVGGSLAPSYLHSALFICQPLNVRAGPRGSSPPSEWGGLKAHTGVSQKEEGGG